MTELEQLRADLATLEAAKKIVKYRNSEAAFILSDAMIPIHASIAALEAQEATADEWAGVKVIIADWLNHPYNTHIQGISLKKFANYVHHLESKIAELEEDINVSEFTWMATHAARLLKERDDALAKVTELENELRCERIDGGKVRDDLRAEIAARDSVAYLGDFRVLKTAQDIAEYSEKSANSPHNLILCRDLVAAINNFTLYVRLWEGLSSLDPYKWSSVGLYDEHLIDKKDGGKVRDDRRAILVEQNRQELAELTTIANAIPPACGLAKELVEKRIEGVKKEIQGNG